jgi:FlaA1/EpsC-like NDP-sugar epimerase
MNIATKAIDLLVNPPRISDPKRLRAAVDGKTVLVTGASYGLGEATAHKLAAAGATTLLVARRRTSSTSSQRRSPTAAAERWCTPPT